LEIRIADIIDAIQRIQTYTRGMERESFLSNLLVRDAVVRNFTVMGEAASHIPEDVRLEQPTLPWVEMQRMRNVVVHEYFGIDYEIIWSTIEDDLPPLLDALIAWRDS
jgi:uncharacterized protein with HEPN domain